MPSLLEEFAAIREGVGLAVLPDAILRFKGADAREMLQGALSNDMKTLQSGKGIAALHLTPKGKWVAALKLFELENAIWAHTSLAEAKALPEALKNLILFSQTELSDLSEENEWILGVGKEALNFASEMFRFDPERLPLSHQTVIVDGLSVEVMRDFDWSDFPAFLLLLPRTYESRIRPTLTELSTPYPVAWIGEETLKALRIEAGRPFYGVDIDEGTIPQEANVEEGFISYTKGCYVGQETISRVKHYGRVHKRLAKLGGKEAFPENASLFFDGKEVGKVTSASRSLTSEGWVALSLLPSLLATKGTSLELKIDSFRQAVTVL
ncbi:MAG: glycine cleavage T C-terminal barrel domain-containing protein [bacterium]